MAPECARFVVDFDVAQDVSRGSNTKVFSCHGEFGDFGVSDAVTVAGRYTRRGGPRLSVQGEPLVVLTRGP